MDIDVGNLWTLATKRFPHGPYSLHGPDPRLRGPLA